jgi:NAD kinase
MFNVPEPVRGCICPPTSEQTCMSPTCPRKAPQPPVVVRYSNNTRVSDE